MKCRMCDSQRLYEFLDLGSTPPADEFKRADQLREPDTYYPLQVLMCEECGLAQLGYVVAPEILYQNEYPYESSTTESGRRHWARFASSVVDQLRLPPGKLVVDIGSNVGVLLEAFADEGMIVHGVDPAPNLVEKANSRGIDTLCAFFGTESAREIVREKGLAAVVTGTNVFAHIDDLNAFAEAVDILLDEDGVLIIEVPYFADLVAHTEYDTIYHEHLSYVSVRPVMRFFRRFGMEVFDVQRMEIHGGSIRIFVGRHGRQVVQSIVGEMLAEEEQACLHSRDRLDAFADAVKKNRDDLLSLVHGLRLQGKTMVGLSAPAKGMTLLNYCRMGREVLDFVTEKSPLKIGRYTPGGHIPVVPDDELLRVQPDYALLLAWNFAEEIMQNLDEYRSRGGRFIIPIPSPRIVE